MEQAPNIGKQAMIYIEKTDPLSFMLMVPRSGISMGNFIERTVLPWSMRTAVVAGI